MEAARDTQLDESELEGEIKSLSKRRENQPRKSKQNKDLLQDDDTEEHHFNPFLPSPSSNSLFSSNSSLPKPQFRRKEVSRAKWVEEIGMGEIIEKKGSIWSNTGVIRNGKLYCHIEEICFLAERGALILLDETDIILEMKDIYAKFSEGRNGCTWDSFEAYRHLKLLGYIIGRHGLSWSVKQENKIGSPNSPEFMSERMNDLRIGEINPIFDIYPPNSKFKKTNHGDPSFILCLVRDKPPCRKEVEDLEKFCNLVPLKFCHVDHGCVSFFSFSKVSLPILP